MGLSRTKAGFVDMSPRKTGLTDREGMGAQLQIARDKRPGLEAANSCDPFTSPASELSDPTPYNPCTLNLTPALRGAPSENVGREGRRGRWGTPTMALQISIQH